jgi:Restriction endonuclease
VLAFDADEMSMGQNGNGQLSDSFEEDRVGARQCYYSFEMVKMRLSDGPIELPEPEPKWKLYEKAIARIEESAGNCTVVRNHKIKGRRSGTQRQIDVWLEATVGDNHTVCVAIECRCYSDSPVSIKDIDAFESFLEDVGAHKGVVISHSGFTEGATNRAIAGNIELKTLTLEEAEEFDWEDYVGDSCSTLGDCFGTIRWEFSDGDTEAGYCGMCGSFHIKCGNCGDISSYNENPVITCFSCGRKWQLDFAEGMPQNITELAPEEEAEEEEEEGE